ncbi:restriction endonuclease [Marinomonas polaris]|uniref:restriction endonuclease n=1 Tax=Marinomonas polaris TaxID=293552 RepID=UPI003517D602
MRSVFDWIIRNGWNLFGVAGVIGTFYFSLMYVPDYVQDITNSKVNVVHESLMDDVQELLFDEKVITIEDIDSFIRGKELKRGISYPYTSDELLLQVQERFMENKFIPMEKRQAILKSIKNIRASYSQLEIPVDKPFDWTSILSWVSSALGILMGTIGAASIFKKIKIDKETEVDIASGDIVINSRHSEAALEAHEFEKMVGGVLKDMGVLVKEQNRAYDFGYDFDVKTDEGEYIVEVKRYRRMLGIGTAREFMYKVNETGRAGILIVSSGVTQRTKSMIDQHNKITENNKLFLVVGDSKSKIESELNRILKGKPSNKAMHAKSV